jgi:type IV pilus assembly protein PilO
MGDMVSKLLRLKPLYKAAATAGLLAILSAGYYFLFYTDLAQEISAAEAGQATLRTEKETYEKRKHEYVAYRDELHTLQEEQRELLKALPKKAEIPSFIASVQEQADLSGLEVLSINIDPELPEELYVRIPVRMEVRGSYHTLTKFFKNVSELRRIVNIENFGLVVERTDNEAAPPRLRAKFIAATFRYVDKAGGT